MYCMNRQAYTIKPGDSLYSIAKKMNTSVESIMNENKHLNPNYLTIGQIIYLRPKTETAVPMPLNYNPYSHNIMPTKEHLEPTHSKQFCKLSEEMRGLWEQHIWWTRSLVISIVDSLDDTSEVTTRLLRNPKDLANLYKKFYSEKEAKEIDNLITEHLLIGDKLIRAAKAHDNNAFTVEDKNWYRNADDIARYFNKINNHYNEEELRRLLYKHLDLTKQEVTYRLTKNYPDDIRITDENEKHGLMLADFLSSGLKEKFHLK